MARLACGALPYAELDIFAVDHLHKNDIRALGECRVCFHRSTVTPPVEIETVDKHARDGISDVHS